MDIALEVLLKSVLEECNKAIAAHGGKILLCGYEDGTVLVRFEGGCQGCAMAKLTLRNYISNAIKAAIPCVTDVIDLTNHADGDKPYYKGESHTVMEPMFKGLPKDPRDKK